MLKRFSQLLEIFGAFLLLSAHDPSWAREIEPGKTAAATLSRFLSEAEESLVEGELQIAESRLRSALLEGWLILGQLATVSDDLEGARSAFGQAANAAVETRRARTSLALIHLRLGETSDAISLLRGLVAANPSRSEDRRLLAQALVVAGRPEEAVQELEEALAAAPEDAEGAFNLAAGYLRLGKIEDAERLFAKVAQKRPIPETWVLVGRTYRDFRDLDRARQALRKAIAMDPNVRRARYYLGTVELLDRGRDHLPIAIDRFEEELERSPDDAMARLYHGMALVESRRFSEAVPSLERAAAWSPTRLDALRFLGRCELAQRRAEEAAQLFRQALELAHSAGARDRQLESIHYQLGLALRRTGSVAEAAKHFAAAEDLSEALMEDDRDRFARFLNDSRDLEAGTSALFPPLDVAEVARLSSAERAALDERIRQTLAQTYLNLGVLHLQKASPTTASPARLDRLQRAAEHFEKAAAMDADFPRVQHSLGVAYFNAQRFSEAIEPLEKALASEPRNAELQRMLAMAYLNLEEYGRAAELLAEDEIRASQPPLQYAYALALVRDERLSEAQMIFESLLAEHAEWPELHVLLGQAHAKAGDYLEATAALERALDLKPDVAEAHATLGDLFLRQGRLDEAEEALLAELRLRPEDIRTRYHLATVLDLNRKGDAARRELERVLKARPEFADARYLLGKILLAQGAAQDAAAQLEAAARLAPQDPNIFYQLGQAYQRSGQPELAERQFEIYRNLKKAERGGGP